MKPFFSIITPSFNQGKYITACLDSIKAQTDESYEHIIVDNCSTDETREILAEYAQGSRVRLLIEPDHGQSEAVNKGFRMAQGEIMCWLNSDDAYLPETLTKVRQAFVDPNRHVIFGEVRQISYTGEAPTSTRSRFQDRRDLIRWWSSRAQLHQPAIFFRRTVREKVGFLNEELHYAMDYDYWWRMSAEYDFHHVPEELAIQHRQPDSKTMKAWYRVLLEREKVFSPFYSLMEEKKSALDKERSQSLAAHFLLQAYAAVEKDRSTAWFYFQKALLQSPLLVLRPSSLGLLRQLFFSYK
ncbi:MAG: glycosyltransferase family 2 protein [Chthoniobacterales bacterium]